MLLFGEKAGDAGAYYIYDVPTQKLRLIGTAACPPYHLAVVIGGTSAEFALKTAKLASAKYLDSLPTLINPNTGRLHTHFHQAVAATGRLSSSEPNSTKMKM